MTPTEGFVAGLAIVSVVAIIAMYFGRGIHLSRDKDGGTNFTVDPKDSGGGPPRKRH